MLSHCKQDENHRNASLVKVDSCGRHSSLHGVDFASGCGFACDKTRLFIAIFASAQNQAFDNSESRNERPSKSIECNMAIAFDGKN